MKLWFHSAKNVLFSVHRGTTFVNYCFWNFGKTLDIFDLKKTYAKEDKVHMALIKRLNR